MIWFDLKEMERKISTNDISEKESIKYYLALFIIISIYAIIAALMQKTPVDVSGSSVALHYLIDTIILVMAVLYIYKQNVQIDNKDFFLRFFSLSFVIFIRLIVYTICIGLILLVLIGFFIKIQDLNKDIMSYMRNLWKIIYYILIVISFQRINKLKQQNLNNGNQEESTSTANYI